MYEQIREDTIFIMLYAVVTAIAMIASCYLYFRRGNAFAPDITPPVRLRKWTAAFLASIALNHVWYIPILFLTSEDDILLNDIIGGMLDSMTVFPLAIVVLLTMLQDRRRPLWPVAVMVMPITLGMAACAISRSEYLYSAMYVYLILLGVGLIIYMVRATRQYGRWLRENYADLEHKEVWQSLMVLSFILFVFVIYEFTSDGPIYQYAIEVVGIVLICYLLWRVETLSDLSITVNEEEEEAQDSPNDPPLSVRNDIGLLLKKYCEEEQLYLQHDISIIELAKHIGTNRSYLSRYFGQQGITYNAYINGLRVQHFINLYHEAVASHQPVTAQNLAHQSGFRNYNTFSTAFKRITGMTTTEWMRHVKT